MVAGDLSNTQGPVNDGVRSDDGPDGGLTQNPLGRRWTHSIAADISRKIQPVRHFADRAREGLEAGHRPGFAVAR